jgi:catechol 2,3-dioxygenase-like lactoylglutathione lyase family enzyme
MLKAKEAFTSFAVNDLRKAKEFYTRILALKVDNENMGLNLHLPGGGRLFLYSKENHKPATFTVLNFVVDNIDDAVEELNNQGVQLERYEGISTDEKGILRGRSKKQGPDIAWFKDPAGNILSVIERDH